MSSIPAGAYVVFRFGVGLQPRRSYQARARALSSSTQSVASQKCEARSVTAALYSFVPTPWFQCSGRRRADPDAQRTARPDRGRRAPHPRPRRWAFSPRTCVALRRNPARASSATVEGRRRSSAGARPKERCRRTHAVRNGDVEQSVLASRARQGPPLRPPRHLARPGARSACGLPLV